MEVIFGIALRALLCFLCYNTAKKNGRNTGWAIFWGFMGGIFAWIVYLLIGEVKEETSVYETTSAGNSASVESSPTSTDVICPNCGKSNKAHATFCANCGTKLK